MNSGTSEKKKNTSSLVSVSERIWPTSGLSETIQSPSWKAVGKNKEKDL